MKIILEVLDGTLKGKSQTFEGRVTIQLGRDPSCDFSMDAYKDLKTSGRHGEIVFKDGHAYYHDLGSSNGSFIDGRKILKDHPVLLNHQDIITLGNGGPKIVVRFPDSVRDHTADQQMNPDDIHSMVRQEAANQGRRAMLVVSIVIGLLATGIFVALAIMIVNRDVTPPVVTSDPDAERKKLDLDIANERKILDAWRASLAALDKKIATIKRDTSMNQGVKAIALRDNAAVRRDYIKKINDTRAQLNALIEKRRKFNPDDTAPDITPRLIAGADLQNTDIDALKEELANLTKKISVLDASLRKIQNTITSLSDASMSITGDEKSPDAVSLKSLQADAATKQKQLDELKARRSRLLQLITSTEAAVTGRFSEWYRKYHSSLFLIYVESGGKAYTGTAFCVRNDGVLATNAHLVQHPAPNTRYLIIQNESQTYFTPTRIYLHPDYAPDTTGPDLALIKIDVDESHNCVPVKLADMTTLAELQPGQKIGSYSFPGVLFAQYGVGAELSGEDVRVIATFNEGVISRITTFSGERGNVSTRNFIQHSILMSGGTSGAPMIGGDDTVVAVNYQAMVAPDGSRTHSGIGWAIRINLVRDMLKDWDVASPPDRWPGQAVKTGAGTAD